MLRASGGTPKTMFRTPAGRPASVSALPMAMAVAGVSSLGLMVMEQPAARAPATLRMTFVAGKFQATKATHRANRFIAGLMLHIRNARRDDPAIDAFALFGVPAQQVDGDAKFVPGLANRLAHFTSQIGADILKPVFEKAGGLLQYFLAAVRGHPAPDIEAVTAACQGGVKIGRTCMQVPI